MCGFLPEHTKRVTSSCYSISYSIITVLLYINVKFHCVIYFVCMLKVYICHVHYDLYNVFILFFKLSVYVYVIIIFFYFLFILFYLTLAQVSRIT